MTDEKALDIIDKAIEQVKKLKTAWRVNYSIGFRNGDVHGGAWEDETLLNTDEKSRINYLKNMGTKQSLAQQIIELEETISEIMKSWKSKHPEDFINKNPNLTKYTGKKK